MLDSCTFTNGAPTESRPYSSHGREASTVGVSLRRHPIRWLQVLPKIQTILDVMRIKGYHRTRNPYRFNARRNFFFEGLIASCQTVF